MPNWSGPRHPEWMIGERVKLRHPMEPNTGPYVFGVIVSKGAKYAYVDVEMPDPEKWKELNVPYDRLLKEHAEENQG